ncbi:hypothetical protein JCM11641_006448 [Rhodosporidiobolus odoratus]
MPLALAYLLLATASLCRVQALFSQGTIGDRGYPLTYSGYDDTTAFCTAFRAECVDYVGALNYHHNLDCVVNQKGPTVFAWCGGVLKDADGDTGSGPAYDFTDLVCPLMKGCTIAAQPVEPVAKYDASVAALSATSGSSSAVTSSGASIHARHSGKAIEAEETTLQNRRQPLYRHPVNGDLASQASSSAASGPASYLAAAAALHGSTLSSAASAQATTASDEASSASPLTASLLVLAGSLITALVCS